MNEKEIMTVKQVSEYLQRDEHTVYKLARSGQTCLCRLPVRGTQAGVRHGRQVPSLKIAGQWRL